MKTSFNLRLRTIALAAGSLLAFQAHAADALTDAMQAAYAPYRVALFKTNGESQDESQQAIKQAQAAWAKLSEQFAAKAPAPYDRDTALATSLSDVSKVYTKASEQVSAKQLASAHETLEAARDIMADMRHRNNVVVFSDHMNAYHSEMEKLLIDGPKIMTKAHGMHLLSAQAGVLAYLSKRLTSEAPANLNGNAEFRKLVIAVDLSIAALQAALLTDNFDAVKDAMSKVKKPYSQLFLKFG